MGFAAWIDQISEEDCELVKCLERAGAVLYCRSKLLCLTGSAFYQAKL